jgi:hypothetical protein
MVRRLMDIIIIRIVKLARSHAVDSLLGSCAEGPQSSCLQIRCNRGIASSQTGFQLPIVGVQNDDQDVSVFRPP